MDPGTETITVNAQAQPTRASKTGGIVSYLHRLRLCLDSAWVDHCNATSDYSQTVARTFTTANWDQPQQIHVRAIDSAHDGRVEGQDTHVFAPSLNQVNKLQGPLFVNGGEGKNRTGLLEREPLMLPAERNETPSTGHVFSGTPGTQANTLAATVTINPSALGTIAFTDVSVFFVQDIPANATAGTVPLTYGGVPTSPLTYNTVAGTVEQATARAAGLIT